ncbi:MAG: RAD55 family ATPase [Candidatus Helarchaeota archaeon]
MTFIELVKTGNKYVDILIPEGIPRNTFFLINGEPGTGKGAFLSELVYKRLKFNEPVIYFTLDDSPLSIIQRLAALGWDIVPYLKDNKIKFIDCFSYRMIDKESPVMKIPRINEQIWKEVEEDIIPCEPKQNLYNMLSTVSSLLNKINIVNKGILVIDSLTELATTHTQERALEFIKTLRARLCKERFIQIFAVNNIGIPQLEVFSSLLNYFSDGIIDFRFEPSLMKKGILIKQFRIRKLSGTESRNIWLTFTIKKDKGLTVSDKVIQAIMDSYNDFLNGMEGTCKVEKEK